MLWTHRQGCCAPPRPKQALSSYVAGWPRQTSRPNWVPSLAVPNPCPPTQSPALWSKKHMVPATETRAGDGKAAERGNVKQLV